RSVSFHCLAFCSLLSTYFLFFSPHPAPPVFYTLSLHDALPICVRSCDERAEGTDERSEQRPGVTDGGDGRLGEGDRHRLEPGSRSEEHTSELQSRFDLVCRLLLEKKKGDKNSQPIGATPTNRRR